MSLVLNFIDYFYEIILSTWVFIVLGFLAAVAIQVLIPRKKIADNFGKNNISSIINSCVAGLVLSACSYGAVPIIAGLRKKGATAANCLTMLLASPWFGLSQFVIITSYVGINNSVIMLLLSLFLSIVGGLIFAKLEKSKKLEGRQRITHALLVECNCEDVDSYINKPVSSEELIDLSVSLGKNLLIAILIAALVKAVVLPVEVESLLGGDFISVLIAVPLGTLLEAVGEGLGVFAGVLYSMGASLGVVFSIIMVGVTTDVTELSMLNSVFGKNTLKYYILVSTSLIVIGSFALNILL